MTAKGIALAVAAFFALAGAALAQPSDGDGPRGGHFSAVRQACQDDIAKLCGDQQPGGGHIHQCLASHSDQVSDGCKSAIAQVQQWRHDHQQGVSDGPPQGSPPN